MIRSEATIPGLYVLERSETLVTWEEIQRTIVTEPGPLEFRDTSGQLPSKPSMFYRIGLTPPATTPSN